MMDEKFRTAWVQALRSGKFQQCRDDLTDGLSSFCCIGVGYEVLGRDCDDLQSGVDDPTHQAASAIGIPPDIRDELIVMNDGSENSPPKSFVEIADYIETLTLPRSPQVTESPHD